MYFYSFPQFLGTFPDFSTISGLKIQKIWRYAPFLLYMKPNLCTEHAPAPKMPQKQGRNSYWGILRVGEEIRIFGQNIDPCFRLNKQSRSRTRIIEDEIYETMKEKEKDRKATTITATTATTTTATTTTTTTTTTIKGVVLCNIRKNISLKLKKMAKKSVFYTY